MSSTDTKRLAGLLQSLPPEISIEIYNWTFSAQTGDRVISDGYKTPSLLHVDRRSRQRFAESFYGKGAIFRLTGNLGRRWLSSLPQTHRDLVRKIHFAEDFRSQLRIGNRDGSSAAAIETMLHSVQRARNAASTLGATPGVTYISILCGPEDEERWIACEDDFIKLCAEFPD